MRVTLVIHGMGSGGAERVVATMGNAWAARGWEITLLTFEDATSGSFYPLDERIHYRPLGIAGASRGVLPAVATNARRLLTIRRAVRESHADVVISFLDTVNVRVLLALAGTGVPVVAMEQTDPGQKHLGRVWETLRRWTYRRAARVVVLGQASWE
ncbi:MAG: glycosyltransferase family 4 protein, partial [Chloroflexota bacterium]